MSIDDLVEELVKEEKDIEILTQQRDTRREPESGPKELVNL